MKFSKLTVTAAAAYWFGGAAAAPTGAQLVADPALTEMKTNLLDNAAKLMDNMAEVKLHDSESVGHIQARDAVLDDNRREYVAGYLNLGPVREYIEKHKGKPEIMNQGPVVENLNEPNALVHPFKNMPLLEKVNAFRENFKITKFEAEAKQGETDAKALESKLSWFREHLTGAEKEADPKVIESKLQSFAKEYKVTKLEAEPKKEGIDAETMEKEIEKFTGAFKDKKVAKREETENIAGLAEGETMKDRYERVKEALVDKEKDVAPRASNNEITELLKSLQGNVNGELHKIIDVVDQLGKYDHVLDGLIDAAGEIAEKVSHVVEGEKDTAKKQGGQ